MPAATESRAKTHPVILIVDDHAAVRSALCDGIQACLPDSRCLEATSGEEAVRSAAASAPDIVLMDIEMPGMNGIEATRLIRAGHPAAHIVVLSVHDEPNYRTDARAAGADAFVSKRNVHNELIALLGQLTIHKHKKAAGC
jgi:DNA-binding NarL/FixJ family response regulator